MPAVTNWLKVRSNASAITGSGIVAPVSSRRWIRFGPGQYSLISQAWRRQGPIRRSIIASGLGVAIPRNSSLQAANQEDRKSTRLNSSHVRISYAVFCLKKKKKKTKKITSNKKKYKIITIKTNYTK